MDAVFSFFKGIVDLGAAVMLPIVLIIIGLFFRMKLGQAIKSGLMVGIGFQGLCLVVNLLTTSIQPVIKYYQSMGGGFTTTDLGCCSRSCIMVCTICTSCITVDYYFELNFTKIKINQRL